MTILTTWGHACVSIDRDEHRLVIDPGAFSDLSVLDTADAILLTHDHMDHLAVDPVATAVARRTGLEVWGPQSAASQLIDAGAPSAQVHVASEGHHLTIGGFAIRTFGHEHRVIHPDIPRPENVGYLVDGRIFHPGDALTEPPVPVDVLLVPVAGPWLKLGEAIDYVRAVQPRIAVPIHDAIASDPGKALADQMVGGQGRAAQYRRLSVGESLDLG